MDDIMKSLMDTTGLPGLDGEKLVVHEPLELIDVKSQPSDRTPDLEQDYESVRLNMHYQQQMLLDAAKIYLETAKNSDNSKHMDTFTSIMGQMTNVNKEILKLHKEMKEITSQQVSTTKAQNGTNNQVNVSAGATVFLGSPTDLMNKVGDAFSNQHNLVDSQ